MDHAKFDGAGRLVYTIMVKVNYGLIAILLGNRGSRRNMAFLAKFTLALVVLIFLYSFLFHYLMRLDGREYSWVTGFYWTLTVMSTLGFGDITFTSDRGMIFSIIVLLTGTTFMLALFPFLFIQFFYTPWLAAQQTARSPRRLPSYTTGHVIITHYDEVTRELIEKLNHYRYPYALICQTTEETLKLRDVDVNAFHGELDDPETYHNLNIGKAAMVVATGKDEVNAHVAFTVRELVQDKSVVATASDPASVDILQLAGCSHVIQLAELMGQALARRTLVGDAMAHIIGRFDELLIAEATTHNTPLVGKTLKESGLREMVSVSVVGVWERGRYILPQPDTVINKHSMLVLAGSKEQLHTYDDLFCIYNTSSSPVVIIGGGRVGRATGRALQKKGIDYRIVEKLSERIRDKEKYILGNAAELDVLQRAGIQTAPAVIITSHEDDANVYLTIYCRRLRPDIQIISRAIQERNVSTLHRAGADIVMSYSAMGASVLFNLLKRNDIVMVTEGLDFFRVTAPAALVGKTLLRSLIRQKSGCTVVAIRKNGHTHITPEPETVIAKGDELILVGSDESEKKFLNEFGQ